MMKVIYFGVVIMLVGGCVSGPDTRVVDCYRPTANIKFIPHMGSDPIKQEEVKDPLKKELEMLEHGYIVVGEARYTGRYLSDSAIEYLGTTVKPSLITIYKEVLNSRTGVGTLAMPVAHVTPTVSTTYGAFGQTYTTYGTQTTYTTEYINYNYDASEYSYLIQAYAIPTNPILFGAAICDIESEDNQAAGSAVGVKVKGVAKGYLAIKNGVLAGDYILKYNSEVLQGADDFRSKIRSAKRPFKLTISRSGKRYIKTIR